jgi:hypothetical protein
MEGVSGTVVQCLHRATKVHKYSFYQYSPTLVSACCASNQVKARGREYWSLLNQSAGPLSFNM